MGAQKREREEGDEAVDDDGPHPPNGEAAAAAALPRPGGAAPRLAHCFLVGDLVEGMFVDNCWVAGRIVDARARQIQIEYEKEAADASAPQITGPRYTCERENETPRDVARKTGVPLTTLLALNAERYPDLVGNSRLKAKTTLALPELHVCSEGETPRAIAKRFGRSLELLLEQNGASINSLAAGSKLRLHQQLVLPPVGAESEDAPTSPAAKASPEAVAAGGGGWLPPQLGEVVELLHGRVTMQAAGVSGGRAPPGKGATGGKAAGGGSAKERKGSGGGRGAAAESIPNADDVEVPSGGAAAGEGAWLAAEVVQLVAGGGFHARLAPEAGADAPIAMLQVTEALWQGGEGDVWRRGRLGGGGGRGGLAADAPVPVLAVGTEVEIEVAEETSESLGRPVVRWRGAEVRALLDAGKFAVCVDGDEDFVEEYGPEDEGTEWRHRAPTIDAERRASEWTTHAFIRPRVPVRPPTGLQPRETDIACMRTVAWPLPPLPPLPPLRG